MAQLSTTDLQGNLEALRGVYERSRDRVNGTDKEWTARKEALTNEVTHMIKSFQADDPATKAVYIIGRVQSAIKELDAPRLIVMDYENKRKQYAQLCVTQGTTAVQF